MSEPVCCVVCTNPLRTSAELGAAVCSTCRPAYRAGMHAAIHAVIAHLNETAEKHKNPMISAALWIIVARIERGEHLRLNPKTEEPPR